MQENSHYDFEMMIEHHVTAQQKTEKNMRFRCVYAPKSMVPPSPPVVVGVNAEEICRCRSGSGHAKRQSYVACRGFQLSGRGPRLFKAALAAEQAKI